MEKLYLNSNQLKIISIEFQHLSNLKELDLSFNLIYSISNNSFEKNDHLRMLYLNNNNITNVNIFNSLKNLKHLRLQSNNISNINRAFKNIVQIEAINLSKNTITTLKSFDFTAQKETIVGMHNDAIRCVHYCPDVNLVITGGWDNLIKLWDPRKFIIILLYKKIVFKSKKK